MKTPCTVTALNLERIATAQDLLGTAASYLQDARTTRAVATVRRAQKSIGGALRHATRLHRTKRCATSLTSLTTQRNDTHAPAITSRDRA